MREKAGEQDSIIHGLKCSLKKLGYSLLCKQWNPLKGVKAWKAMQFRKISGLLVENARGRGRSRMDS